MGSETILLVNDEKGIRDLAREKLVRNGYIVLEAKDGADALEISERHENPIHLVVTDDMPEMNGWDLAQLLTRLRPEMKVIYMSGTPHKALDLGPVAIFLPKPFSMDTLASVVRVVLQLKNPRGKGVDRLLASR